MAKPSKKPELVSSILKKTLESLNLGATFKKYSVWEYWNEIVGKRVAEKAEPSHMMGDTLVVKVISHPWMNELSLMKPVLLQKIQTKIEGCPIKNIRFELALGVKREMSLVKR